MIKMDNLSLEEKVGQLFLIGIDGTIPTERLTRLIQRYRIGGVLVSKNNIDSLKQLIDLTNSLKDINVANGIPLFIAIDEGDGDLSILPSEIKNIPGVRKLASTGNKNLLREAGLLTGDVLRNIGFNLNLAPVLDVESNGSKLNIRERSFSSNPNIVASYGITNMQAMNEEKIITAIKYFPGYGSVTMDSQGIIIPYTTKKLSKLEESDLLPFKEAIKDGAECMMVGNINLSKFNLFAPATTSKKVIEGLIRQRYGYQGVLLTDDIGAVCMDVQYGIKDSARRAIKAGNDIVMIKEERRAESVIEYITKLFLKERLDITMLNESVERILKLKSKYIANVEHVGILDIDNINNRIENLKTNI